MGTFLRQNNARILQEAVDDILIWQKAEEAGMRVPPQYVDEAIANIKKENNFTTEEQFEEALSREGMTLGELRANIERGIVRRSVVERDIRSRVEVSESELKAEYEKRKAGGLHQAADGQPAGDPDQGGRGRPRARQGSSGQGASRRGLRGARRRPTPRRLPRPTAASSARSPPRT